MNKIFCIVFLFLFLFNYNSLAVSEKEKNTEEVENCINEFMESYEIPCKIKKDYKYSGMLHTIYKVNRLEFSKLCLDWYNKSLKDFEEYSNKYKIGKIDKKEVPTDQQKRIDYYVYNFFELLQFKQYRLNCFVFLNFNEINKSIQKNYDLVKTLPEQVKNE